MELLARGAVGRIEDAGQIGCRRGSCWAHDRNRALPCSSRSQQGTCSEGSYGEGTCRRARGQTHQGCGPNRLPTRGVVGRIEEPAGARTSPAHRGAGLGANVCDGLVGEEAGRGARMGGIAPAAGATGAGARA
jgi:hypothetical protein